MNLISHVCVCVRYLHRIASAIECNEQSVIKERKCKQSASLNECYRIVKFQMKLIKKGLECYYELNKWKYFFKISTSKIISISFYIRTGVFQWKFRPNTRQMSLASSCQVRQHHLTKPQCRHHDKTEMCQTQTNSRNVI